MTPFQRMMQALSTGQGGSTRFVKPIADWLRGQPLTDPGAIAWLKQFYPDLSQAGKDSGQTVGSVVQEPSTVGSAVREQPAGTGLAAGAASSMYNSVPAVPNAPPVTTPAGRAGLGDPTISFADPVAGAKNAGRGGISFQSSPEKGRPPMNPVPTPSAAPTQQLPEAGRGSAATPRNLPEGGGGSPVNPNDPTRNVPGAGGGPVGGGGGLSVAQAGALGPGATNNDMRVRMALKAAGYDPYSRSLRTQYLAQALGGPLAALGETLGLDGQNDTTTYLDQLKNAVLSLTTPGRNGAAELRNRAQGILNSPGFNSLLEEQDGPPQQAQLLQNLLANVYQFENPFVQSAAKNVFGTSMDQYQDESVFGSGADPGLFSQYANRDPNSKIAQLLRGMAFNRR